MSAEESLSIEQINDLTGDDLSYWLGNPFMDTDLVSEKVRFWVTKAVRVTIAQAAVEWSARANEGLSASVLAAKAEAWDEGYLRGTLDTTSDLEPADNPYLGETP